MIDSIPNKKFELFLSICIRYNLYPSYCYSAKHQSFRYFFVDVDRHWEAGIDRSIGLEELEVMDEQAMKDLVLQVFLEGGCGV